MDTRAAAEARNDAKVLAYAKKRVVTLEQELRTTQTELKLLKAKPALATQREEYVLGEVEHSNRQLEGMYPTIALVIFLCLPC